MGFFVGCYYLCGFGAVLVGTFCFEYFAVCCCLRVEVLPDRALTEGLFKGGVCSL